LLDVLEEDGIGCIAFSPLEQGLLTNRYLEGYPEDSRVVKDGRYLKKAQITTDRLDKVKMLNAIALRRGQSLAQMAIVWLLKDPRVTSVLIGASKVSQVEDNIGALANLHFTPEELNEIQQVLAK
jgi:L-glyceraldehyde 3-phosphate reductase